MGTVSRLPEKIRTTAPILESESEAFNGVQSLIRRLTPANDGFAASGKASPLFPAISGSGLLGITVPSEYGGADVSNTVLGEIVLSAAAASRIAAAWLASHFHAVELLRGSPATATCQYFHSRALAGDLFLMPGKVEAGDEPGTLSLTPETGRPGWRLNGRMKSTTDPIHADWIVIGASDAEGDHAVFIPRMTNGLRLTPDEVSFSNVHVAQDCHVKRARQPLSTAAALESLLRSAQKLGWAERKLNDILALHARPSMQRRSFGPEYLSALGLTVSRIENGKAALERAGRKIDTAQVNTNEETVQTALFSSAIALSSAAEAFDLAAEIGAGGLSAVLNRMDPYGHAPIGARLLENSPH